MAAESDSSQNVSVEHEKISVSFPSAFSHPSEAAAAHHYKIASLPTDKKPRGSVASSPQHYWTGEVLETHLPLPTGTNIAGTIQTNISASNMVSTGMQRHFAAAFTKSDATGAAGDAGLGDNDTFWNIVKKFEDVAVAEAPTNRVILSGGASPGRSSHSASSAGALSSGSAVTSIAKNHVAAAPNATGTNASAFDLTGLNRKMRNGSASEVSSQGTQTSFRQNGNAVVLINGHTAYKLGSSSSGPGSPNRNKVAAGDVAEKVHDCVRTCIDQLKNVCLFAEPAVGGAAGDHITNDSTNDSTAEIPVSTNVEINRTRLSLSKTQQQAVDAVVEHARENAVISLLHGKYAGGAVPTVRPGNGKIELVQKEHRHRDSPARQRTHKSKRHQQQLPNGAVANRKSSKKSQAIQDGTERITTDSAVEEVDGAALRDCGTNKLAGDSNMSDSLSFGNALSRAGINAHDLPASSKWETVVNHIMVLQGVITAKNKEIHMLHKSAKQMKQYIADLQQDAEGKSHDIDALTEHIDGLKQQLDTSESKFSRQLKENRELWNDVITYRNSALEYKHQIKSLERRLGQAASVNGNNSSNGSSSDLYTLPTGPKIDRVNQKLDITRRNATPSPQKPPSPPAPIIKEVEVQQYTRQDVTIDENNNNVNDTVNAAPHSRHHRHEHRRRHLQFWK